MLLDLVQNLGEWFSESFKCVCESVSEWVCESVSEWVGESINEWVSGLMSGYVVVYICRLWGWFGDFMDVHWRHNVSVLVRGVALGEEEIGDF